MRKQLLLILLFLIWPALFVMAQSSIRPDTIEQTGIMRPNDVLRQDIRWNAAAPDLFTYWIDNGLYGFYGPQPEIFVDGIPVDANYFGWQNLNMVPVVAPLQNDSDLSPQTYKGTVSPAGYIDFQSAPVDTGLAATASIYAGNEIGDPGPYAYDSLKMTPNIDRWGPDGEFALSYRNNQWYAKSRFLFRNHEPTDLASNNRLHFTSSLLGTNTGYVNHPIFINSKSGLFETGYQSTNWGFRTQLTAGKSADYLFLQPFGREVPAETGYRQIAVESHFSTGYWNFVGRYIGREKTIDKRIEFHPYIFDWQQQRHSVSFFSTYRSGKLHIKPGVEYGFFKNNTPGLGKGKDEFLTFSLDAVIPTGSHSKLKGYVNTDFNNGNVSRTYKFSFPTQLLDSWTIRPGISSIQVLPVRQHSFSYWVNRGYTFAGELGIEYDSSVSIEKNDITVFKLRNDFQINSNLSLVLTQQLINHQTLNIPYQQVEENEFITDTKPGSFSLTQEDGSRVGLYGQINHKFHGIFQQSLSVNIQKTLSGSERYQNYFKQIPETKILYQLDIQPVHSLVLSLQGLYRSSTKWTEFQAIEGNEYQVIAGIPIRNITGTFHTKTPSYFDMGLDATKWFWNRRIKVQFSINNLLDEEIRMHPLGGRRNTKFDVKLTLQL